MPLLLAADFTRFVDAHPDFAEEYLHPDQTRLTHCTQTLSVPTPNGFCADFSPDSSGFGRKPCCKKLD